MPHDIPPARPPVHGRSEYPVRSARRVIRPSALVHTAHGSGGCRSSGPRAPECALDPCAKVGQMRCIGGCAALSEQTVIGTWYYMDGSCGYRMPFSAAGGYGERCDAFFDGDKSIRRAKDCQMWTAQLPVVANGIVVVLSLEECPRCLVQRFDIGAENVVLWGGCKKMQDVGVLAVMRRSLGKIVIKPQRRCLVMFRPGFSANGPGDCKPVRLPWRHPGARVGDHEVGLARPRGCAERNPSTLAMPEQAHGSGVAQHTPQSRDRSDCVICQVVQGPGRPVSA